LYHIDQFRGSPRSSGSKSTSKLGSNVKSVPRVVILVAVLVAVCLETWVDVRVRARSSLSESDLEDVGDVSIGDQNSLCEGVCGDDEGLSGHWETTTGGIAFSGSPIMVQDRAGHQKLRDREEKRPGPGRICGLQPATSLPKRSIWG
jgi:hypothetical protein